MTCGLEVSAIALGCFAFGGDRKTGSHLGAQMTALHNGVWGDQDDEDTFATVKAALDAGVNFFDNACAPTAPAVASESYLLTRVVLAERCTATATRRR